ncbi:MAG: helix-turn-helix domain-containing protein [Betaproteobacteria bacterium]|nr:helix-turn-helix domain-containing protein [Betaproteobacteria bacterium]
MRTITRAFSVFNCFSDSSPKLSLQEISKDLRLAKSTTFRLVAIRGLTWRQCSWNQRPFGTAVQLG